MDAMDVILSRRSIRKYTAELVPEKLINEIDKFQPKFLGASPNMLRNLAFLKNNGYGKHINPKNILSFGSILDSYTREYVEKTFDTKILDNYGTTETGPLAFECILGGYYHVNSDFVFLEFLDDQNKPVPYGEPGHLVVTRLYGEGTPIIRYTGIRSMIIRMRLATVSTWLRHLLALGMEETR